ncbi:MSC1 protein [Colletotrichum tofieldiae]|nr:MSC1 protein [Colletotrichum tofieldiae]
MRFLPAVLTALAAQGAIASTWFSKAAYNKWHETELERWLSDHDVPYPTPADRKDLEKLIENNWNSYAVAPYNSWDTDRLQNYLKAKGLQTEGAAKANKESLVSQVQNAWYETGDQAQNAYLNVKDWILDSWTDSQLKAFADKHGIPGHQRKNPGILDLTLELTTRQRDKLIASVRRNSRLASLKAQEQAASASASAQQAYATLTDMVIDAWSDSQLKEFADKNGIPVPQGTKTNELKALIRKHRADFLQNNVSGAAASAFGAATSNVAEKKDASRDELVSAAQSAYSSASSAGGASYASVTSYLSQATDSVKSNLFDTWSESELKSYLDSYGVDVPQGSTVDELRAYARKQYTYFKYGTSTPSETLYAKIAENAKGTWNWVANQVGLGADAAQKKAADTKKAAENAKKEEL